MKAKNPIRAVKSEALESIHKARAEHTDGLKNGGQIHRQRCSRHLDCLSVHESCQQVQHWDCLGPCEWQTWSFSLFVFSSPLPHRRIGSNACVVYCWVCLMPVARTSTELSLQISFILCSQKYKPGKSDHQRQSQNILTRVYQEFCLSALRPIAERILKSANSKGSSRFTRMTFFVVVEIICGHRE